MDLGRKEELTARARERGITIVTLSEEVRRNPDYLRCLHQLHNLIQMDVPRAGYFTPVGYDEFADEFRRGTHLPDGYFIAKSGQRYVGLSYLQAMDGDPDTLEVGLTGVRREYRRRGIAAALKFHTLSFAKENGFQAIETGSDSARTRRSSRSTRVWGSGGPTRGSRSRNGSGSEGGAGRRTCTALWWRPRYGRRTCGRCSGYGRLARIHGWG